MGIISYLFEVPDDIGRPIGIGDEDSGKLENMIVSRILPLIPDEELDGIMIRDHSQELGLAPYEGISNKKLNTKYVELCIHSDSRLDLYSGHDTRYVVACMLYGFVGDGPLDKKMMEHLADINLRACKVADQTILDGVGISVAKELFQEIKSGGTYEQKFSRGSYSIGLDGIKIKPQ